MGSGCCGKPVQENESILAKVTGYEPEQSVLSSAPLLSPNYRSVPNQFHCKWESPKPIFNVSGLTNLGNTCYANAALQVLANCQPLVYYFLSGVFEHEIRDHNETVVALAELISVKWLESGESLNPQRLLDSVSQKHPEFTRGKQHDAQEFLTILLQDMHEGLLREAPITSDQLPDLEGEENEAAAAWKQYLEDNDSIVTDCFLGQLRSLLTCVECHSSSRRFECFTHISVEVVQKQRCTLVDCLQLFTNPERIEAGWHCPKCEKVVTVLKEVAIWKAPPILIVNLKRFSETGKVRNFVAFPVYKFDATDFTAGTHSDDPVYNLIGVINHMGEQTQGHYTAHILNAYTYKWFNYNDHIAAPIEIEDIVQPHAYVLIYQKTTPSQYFRQSKTLPRLWPHTTPRTDRISTKGQSSLRST